MSFIVKTLPSIWESAAPRVQVTFSGRGRRRGSLVQYNAVEILWVLTGMHDFTHS